MSEDNILSMENSCEYIIADLIASSLAKSMSSIIKDIGKQTELQINSCSV